MNNNNYEEQVTAEFEDVGYQKSPNELATQMFLPEDRKELNFPKSLWRYLVFVGVYILFFADILGAMSLGIIDVFVKDNNAFYRESTSHEIVHLQTRYNIGGLGIIEIDQWDSFTEKEQNQLYIIFDYENYYIVSNQYNGIYQTIEDPDGWFEMIDNEYYYLKADVFENIVAGSPGYTTWYKTDNPIEIFVSSESVPDFLSSNLEFVFATTDGFVRTPLFASSINFLTYLILGLTGIICLFPILVNDFLPLLKVPFGETFSAIMTGILFLFGFRIVGTLVNNFISSLAGVVEQTSINQMSIEIVLSGGTLAVVLMFLSAVVVGPLVEELIFRKAFFKFINHKWVALVVSSLVFGFIHVTSEFFSGDVIGGITGLVSYTVGGLAFGYTYIKYQQNIWIPTFVHMATNALALILALL